MRYQNVPGIITKVDVNLNGNPDIRGEDQGVNRPIIEHSTIDILVQQKVNEFSKQANYSYNVTSEVWTGMHWGTPVPGGTQQSPTSCNERNIVYFNTNGTFIRLESFTSGCGMLLVDGDLYVHGGFNWYGVIYVTGSIIFSGGGGKNVTGAIASGGTVSADIAGGDANILYCSRAIRGQTEDMPLITLRWLELFS